MRIIVPLLIITAALLSPLAAFPENTVQEKGSELLSLNDILANYYDAIGGLESWSKVDTMTIEGTIITPKQQFRTTAINMRPNKCRVEYMINEQKAVRAYDGQTVWQTNPLSGGEPSEITGDSALYIKEKCEIEGPLIGYANKNRKVTLEGMENLDGTEVYKVQIAYDTGNLLTYFLDSRTFLPVMTVGKMQVSGKQATVITYFEDYRSVQNIVVPYLLKFDEKGAGPDKALKVQSVSINSAVDSGIFSMPQARPAP